MDEGKSLLPCCHVKSYMLIVGGGTHVLSIMMPVISIIRSLISLFFRTSLVYVTKKTIHVFATSFKRTLNSSESA